MEFYIQGSGPPLHIEWDVLVFESWLIPQTRDKKLKLQMSSFRWIFFSKLFLTCTFLPDKSGRCWAPYNCLPTVQSECRVWSGSIQIIPINSIASTALLCKEPIHLTFLPPYEAAKEIKYKMLKYFQNKYFYSSVTSLCVQFPIFYLNWQADNLCCQIFRFFVKL